MCSNNGEDGKTVMERTSSLFKIHTPCRKCEAEAVIVLKKKFPYCRECFIPYVTHKFFACLGKEKIMKQNDKVLLLCSGSQSSSTLLHLIRRGVEQKKRNFLSQSVVLFIDDFSFVPESNCFRKNLISEIQEMVKQSGFLSDAFYCPLIFNIDCIKRLNDLSWCTDDFLNTNNIHKLYHLNLSNTSKQDLLEKLRSRVAVCVAKELGCNKIFSAETSDHTATKILTNIAVGRGGQLPLDIGFADSRFEDVLIIRPLREWSRKEVAYYILIHHLPIVTIPKMGTLKGNEDSIQKLTEAFVVDLQENFPSTINTVLGTGNKLSTSKTTDSFSTCCLCKAHYNLNNSEFSAVSARDLSHELSTLGPMGFNDTDFSKKNTAAENSIQSCDQGCDNCSCSSINILTYDGIKNYFCYGCLLIIRECNDLSCLPKEIIDEVKEKKILDEMRNSIQDFLI